MNIGRYNELCGVLGILKTNDFDLDWQKINDEMRQACADGLAAEYAEKHVRDYRRMAIDAGLLGLGEIPHEHESIPLV